MGMFSSIGERKVLRPHQDRALEMLRESMSPSGGRSRRVVLQGPTGVGKTLIAAKVITGACAKGNRVIFTTPAISLIDQTVDAFEAEGIRGIGVMQSKHPRTDASAPVQVATVQTLAKRDVPDAALVIVDEVHIHSRRVDALMDERPDVFFIGLSATPWRAGMGERWQDLLVPVTISELIEGGYLSRFKAYAPDVPDLSDVRVRAGDYVESELAEAMSDGKLVGSVVDTWLEMGEGRPTLMFGVNCAHAKTIQAEFERKGVSAGYCDAFTDLVERARLRRKFISGEIKVACSVRTLTTGVDWPVSCIVDAAPTKSEMLHVQKIGRGLRVNPGTEDLLILDHAGNSLRLGLVTDIHHGEFVAKRDKAEPEAERRVKLPKPCGDCGTLHTGPKCPSCGCERRPGSGGVEAVDGNLVEIGNKAQKGPKSSTLSRTRWLAQLRWIGESRGYKPGWAANQYRERWGCWPGSINPAPEAPCQEVSAWEHSRRIRFAKARAKREAAA